MAAHPPASGSPPPSARPSPAVDPALVGTWKLDGVPADVLWVVRADGSYRVHGWAARPAQRGRFEGTRGRWSVNAPNWQDSGTYQLAAPDSWRITSKYGSGVWKRVWHPGQAPPGGPGHGGVCLLLRPAEVAGLLDSPVVDPEGIGARRQGTNEALEGCRYTSRLSGVDRVEIRFDSGSNIAKVYAQGKSAAGTSIPAPGVGQDAYAVVAQSSITLKALTAGRIMALTLALAPGVSQDDLPGLIELGRLAAQRLR
jgi:hypothetical protein